VPGLLIAVGPQRTLVWRRGVNGMGTQFGPPGFDPLIAEWFREQFGAPTDPQVLGWPAIRTADDVLISAPTGSGKTLAAFLICLDQFVREARLGTLPDETRVVYISPLKALSNDVRKNLEIPLAQIRELAEKRGVTLAPIRTAVRTGDTPMWERQQMGRKPPHILVTTPESLYILMTAEKSRAWLRSTRTVIVDEIHAMADDKRGSHLALTLARLDALVGADNATRPQRIGLSATVKPIEEVGNYLGPRTRIVNTGHRRDMDLGVIIPRDELGPVTTHEMWAELYDRIAELILAHRTTLVFVNTRRLSERVAHALTERLGADQVVSHHGSMSRASRLDAETRLKNGALKAVVATASLELGIDIGSVDLVIQVGSTRSIAVALQRFGRAGHWVKATPKARIVATTRDELMECAALIRAIRRGELERLYIPVNSLDILAQQIVAACACEAWEVDALFGRVRTAWPYRNLPRKDFDEIVEMLAEGITTSRGRSGTFLHLDRVNGRVRGRRGARLAAITCGGAIPENANFVVTAEPDGRNVGTIDEDFAVESTAGDVFLLGTHSWRIKRVASGRVFVEDAKGAPPSIPFWLGEAPGRSAELSHAVSETRELVFRSADGAEFLRNECGLDQAGATQLIAYVNAGVAALGTLPTATTVVAERFFDEGGGMQLVLHAPFGTRINRAWGLALRKRFCRTFNFELQAAATDNGILISLAEQHAFPLELVFEFLKPESLEHVLTQAMLDAPMFASRWRWNASRALAVLRFRGGGKVPPPIQRMRSDDLLASVFPDQVACAENLTGEIRIPEHPLVRETIDNCLHEAMDLDGLLRIIAAIGDGEMKTVAIDNPAPSPFSHEILNANPYAFLDDAPLEERRARAVQLRGSLRTDFVGGAGILDAAAIVQVSEDAWPEVRDADELHDAMLSLIRMPAEPGWQKYFDELRAAGRASVLIRGERVFWIATERLAAADDAVQMVRGWMESLGPVTAGALAERLCVSPQEIARALAVVEGQGQVLSGRFSVREGEGEMQWCNRRILARIHQVTLGRLRREIEPVSALDLCRFLCRWQHLAPGSQLHGADGTLQIIRQLQGYEMPASAWEPEVLARRVAKYEPAYLDELCLSGEVMWGRVSPHPSMEAGEERRVRPTRIAPITFFLRESLPWLTPQANAQRGEAGLSPAAQDVIHVLRRRGASFFADLSRGAGRLASEVEDALWELVAAGLVTADGFENLRALLDPKRRRGEGRGRTKRPRHAGGRWAMMQGNEALIPVAAPMPAATRAEAFAEQLILRWGVLIRDLLTKEANAPFWRDLLPVLRQKEARGELRAGRFVAGFSGEQFAAPEAVELLRAMRRAEAHPEDEVQIANADPLNLTGILLPGPRVNTLAGGGRLLNSVDAVVAGARNAY
jgi:ATP-dependent Lhr-like helicase